jgi:sec-independent protein translocase protein TatA
MHLSSPAEIFGVDGIIVLVVVVLVLFGSTQIPKLARSLGSAQKEFKKGLDEGSSDTPEGTSAAQATPPPLAAPAAPASPAAAPPAPAPVEASGDGTAAAGS